MSVQENEASVLKLTKDLWVWSWPDRENVLPPGPWLDEGVDRVQARCPVTGYTLLAVRSPATGAWCGYVAIPARHPLTGMSYSTWRDDTISYSLTSADGRSDVVFSSPEELLPVHGGLTFSGHSNDYQYLLDWDTGEQRTDELWMFGFDAAHAWDVMPLLFVHALPDGYYKDIQYILEQASKLAVQLKVYETHKLAAIYDGESERTQTIGGILGALLTFKEDNTKSKKKN
jgi:hypothetical protein